MAASPEKPKCYFSLAGSANDGWSNKDSVTATCYCGTVQLAFPTQGPSLLSASICRCSDCREITASMLASNFSIAVPYLTHVRGRDNLTSYSQSRTTTSGKLMTNYFYSRCGTLMYRLSEVYPGRNSLWIGTVDDFYLHETNLKPKRESYVKIHVCWLSAVADVRQVKSRSARRLIWRSSVHKIRN